MAQQKQTFSLKEIEECRRTFRNLPTYDPTSRSISTEDMPDLIKKMMYKEPVPPETVKAYQDFNNAAHGGRLYMDNYMQFIRNPDNPVLFALAMLGSMDLDGDGYISAKEFNHAIRCLMVHDPSFPKVSYVQFAEEADTNKDGKVSVDEAIGWFEKLAVKNE